MFIYCMTLYATIFKEAFGNDAFEARDIAVDYTGLTASRGPQRTRTAGDGGATLYP